MTDNRELQIPPAASADAGSVEVLRAWVADEGLHVSMRQAFDDPGTWGVLLVDLARHAARAMAAEKVCTEAEALRAIREIFDAEWDNVTDIGTTQPMRKQ